MMQSAPIPVSPQTEPIKLTMPEIHESLPTPEVNVQVAEPSILKDLASIDRLFITKRLRVNSVLFLRGKKNRFFVERLAIHLKAYLQTNAFVNASRKIGAYEGRHEQHATPTFLDSQSKCASNIAKLDGLLVGLLVRYCDAGMEEPGKERDAMITFYTRESSWWLGYFCYGLRPFQLRVMNSQGAEVMRINRPYACTPRVVPCQLQRIEVFAPPGNLVGTVEQQWTAVRPVYLVKNANEQDIFRIRGPYITLSLFRDVKFQILKLDGTPVGATCKRWQGLTHALFFAAVTDRFGVAFDVDLSVEEKGLLLAATLLIDYMYYDV